MRATASPWATSCSPATAAACKSTDGLTVAAEIVAQAKADKVTVFKKRRRHNYRRKKGHRQQHTILKIVAIGDHKAAEEGRPKAEAAAKAAPRPASRAGRQESETAEATADQQRPSDVAGTPTENPAPNDQKPRRGAAEGRRRQEGAPRTPNAEPASTKNAAPAKGGAKKAPKAK